MQNERMPRSAGLALLGVGIVASGAVLADDLYGAFRTPHADWSIFAGAAYTDDATLVPGGPSDTIATAGLGGSLYRDDGRLKADITGSAYWEDYTHKTYSEHVLGNLVGLVSYAFVPEQFTWVVQDTFGEVTANPLLPTTPANRISANIASTGPDGYLRLGGDTGLALGARYSKSSFQSNPYAQVDNDTVSGNIGLVQHLSPSSTLSLNADATRIEYQVGGHPTYNQYELFGRFSSKTARAGVAIDAGATEVRGDGSTSHDPLVRITLFRRLTPSWNVNLTADSVYQNTSTALQSALAASTVVNGQVVPVGTGGSPPGATGGAADVILSQNAFHSEDAILAFDFVRPRTTINIHGSINRQRYQFGGSGLDRNMSGVGAQFSRRLTPSLTLHANADYVHRQPSVLNPSDRTTYGDAGLDWRPGALLGVTLAYHREDRSADVSGYSYVASRIYLGFTYGSPKHGISVQPPGPGTPGGT